MTRVAAVDCGTNSLRLLVADVEGNQLHDRVRRMEIVRLGEGVDRTGRLSTAALDRTMHVLQDYARQIEELRADRVRMVATSATRDAANSAEFVQRVVTVLGTEPEVVSGAEEAELSFVGATRELADGRDGPNLVVDIGGGSTEFVLGGVGVISARSVDIGCVRLTERHFRDDPPTAAEVAAAEADIDAALTDVEEEVDARSARLLVGLAGSVTTVTGMSLGLERYDATRVHHAEPTRGQVLDVTRRLLGMTHAERAAQPVIHPGRVDVIAAGALVLAMVMDRFGFDRVLTSEHDILDGIAWSLV